MILKPLSELSLSSLPPQALEWLGRALGVALGSAISPTWPMLHLVLQPYMRLEDLLSGDLRTSILTYLHFIQELRHAGPASHLQLLLGLFGCMVVCIGVLYLSNVLGLRVSRFLIKRFHPNPA